MPGSSIDLIWNSEGTGTAVSSNAGVINVGGRDGWTAEELLSVALEADLMSHFLRSAEKAGLAILGYVSAVNLVGGKRATNDYEVVIRPCIVLDRPEDEPAARKELETARLESTLCNSLVTVRVEANFVCTRTHRG